jgi:glucosylceramidase
MPNQTNPYDPIHLSEDPSSVAVWLTTADQAFLFQRQTNDLRFTDNANDFPVITVDAEQTYQVMEGFGFSLTGGSAMLISRLPAPDRSALLRELFLPDGIGISFLRLSIGSSDLSERCFSYNDRPVGEPDPDLIHFDIEAGDLEVIPLLREILAINSEIKIMATAWSAPAWMKTNQSFVGGKLRPDCYAIYAAYLVKYLKQCVREASPSMPSPRRTNH